MIDRKQAKEILRKELGLVGRWFDVLLDRALDKIEALSNKTEDKSDV